MLCPSCKSTDNKVIDSRISEGGAAIRRRRVCQACNRRFTTKERLEEELRLSVIKNSGERVPYNRDNVFNGVARACSKLRQISTEQIQELVDKVETDIFAQHDREIGTEQIGRFVGRHLRKLHPVAYVRFMSVHRKFATIDQFIEEITDVRQRAAHEIPEQQPLFEG